jgi:large subunit ribosomal protein L9
VVKVAGGYARNFLFPRKLALAVTDENKRQIERERARAEAKDAQEVAEAEGVKARLEAVELAIARRVGENETMYGSVTSADIAEALAARDVTIDRRRIQLADALKSLGEHQVAVKLPHGVTAEIKVRIVAAQ